MVASRSGSRPHLVTKGKDGLYHCDGECANYRSLKMCSHVVAVAQVNGDLLRFVESFGKKRRHPNLTKLALHGMPAGRGRKGQQPPRKRARKVPLESSVPFQPSVVTTQSSDAQAVPPDGPFVGATMPASGGPTSTWSPPTPTPTGNPCQVQYNSPSYIQCFPQPSYTSQHVPYPQIPFDPGPFFVTFISGNISVCSGCHNRYTKPASAPYDLCIRHQEWREFVFPGCSVPQKRFGNAYYHPSFGCIESRWPSVHCGNIVLDNEVKQRLLPAHKVFLATHLGLRVD